MKEAEYDLRPIRRAILDIYEEFRKICERNGLTFTASAGTVLGAVRHKGFIPWDDDFDVVLLRPDYDKFLAIVKDELPGNLEWCDAHTNPSFSLTFGKIVDRTPALIETLEQESRLKLPDGVFIDVFPLDALPSTRLGLWCWALMRSIHRRMVWSRTGIRGLCFRLARPFFGYGSDPRKNLFRYMRWLSRGDSVKATMVGHAADGADLTKSHWWPKEWFLHPKAIRFEDIMLPVPGDPDAFLKDHYGDYMKLPPEEMRVPTHYLR